MVRRMMTAVTGLVFGLMILPLIAPPAVGQTKAPAAKSTKLGAPVKGSYVGFNTQLNALQLEAAGTTIYVQVDPKAKTSIQGTADPSFLAPKMFVKFECEANALGEVKAPLVKLTICEQSDIESPAFSIDDPTALTTTSNKKPTKEELAAFKKYFVRGSITKVSDDEELTISVPGTTVKAKVAPTAKIEIQSSQYRYAQPGDDVTVSQGSEVQVAQPMPPAGKQPVKPATPPIPPKTTTGKAGKGLPMPTGPQRFIIAEWLEVTTKQPLTGKKKAAAPTK